MITKVTIEVQGYFDPEGPTFFAAIWMPTCPDSRALLVHLTAELPGLVGTTTKSHLPNRKFSGWVFVYHEDDLTAADEEPVRTAWSAHGLTPSFRSPTWALLPSACSGAIRALSRATLSGKPSQL